ncbi:hypothetical protein D7322_20435 [Sphingobacterium puteale]|uniref:Uncharacterized protein n=2 Tax=Sphingobacterium puteale TaxID=2420510 RepID=A0A420VTG9_9SPHI|nr:hypothetical protein D7322_20435 [Sphingobacterium puteale]
MKNKRVYTILAYNILYVAINLFMYYLLNMKKTGLSFCVIGTVLINVYYFMSWFEDTKKMKFIQRYEIIHQRALSKTVINYKVTFTVSPNILFTLIFGLVICFSAIGIFREQSIAGIFVLFIGVKFTLMPFKEKTAVRLAPNGIWTSDYQFIFINDIQEICFRRYLGKNSSKMSMKIKDPALYGMKDPYLSVPIGGQNQVTQMIPMAKRLFSDTLILQDI